MITIQNTCGILVMYIRHHIVFYLGGGDSNSLLNSNSLSTCALDRCNTSDPPGELTASPDY